jgi:3-phosphoglycerate kinase
MSHPKFNKYRAAVEILQRGRDLLVESLADDVLDQADDLIEGGFLFNEFLETQGTRIHFLSLLVAQLEQSAEALEESRAAELPPPPAPPKKRKTRAKKLPQQASKEGTADD